MHASVEYKKALTGCHLHVAAFANINSVFDTFRKTQCSSSRLVEHNESFLPAAHYEATAVKQDSSEAQREAQD